MRAIVLDRSVSDKILFKQTDIPKLKTGEARVKVMAAALNHRDEWCRQGLYPNIKDGIILGSDASGIVEEVADSKDQSWLGKEVIINPAINWGNDQKVQDKNFEILGMPRNGTLAEYVHVPVDRLWEKPTFLNWEEAAALPLAGLTAYRAFFAKGNLQKSDKVLVTGFGGGVAQFAVQFALASGAEVYTSSGSEDKLALAKKIGVTEGYNYIEPEWSEKAVSDSGGFDLVIDSAMGDTLSNLIKVIRPGGKLVFYGATLGNPTKLDVRRIFWNQIQLMGTTMGSDRDFEDMVNFVRENRIVPIIAGVYDLAHAVEAFDLMKAGGQLGKIVIKP